jgi:GDP-mannose 6-dehydrogenase
METELENVLDHADLLIVGNGDPEFQDIPNRLKAGQRMLDLVRVTAEVPTADGYDGICW